MNFKVLPIYDTNYFVKQISEGKSLINERFWFTDINLCEWLKGPKSPECLFSEFVKIDTFIKQTGSSYIFRNQHAHLENILNSDKPVKYKYKLALKIAKRTFKELVDIYAMICFLLPTIVFVKANHTSIQGDSFTIIDEKDLESVRVNKAIQMTWEIFRKKSLFKTAKDLFALDKKTIDKIWIDVYNEIVKILNEKIEIYSLKPILNKHFNHNNLAVENGIVFSKRDVEIITNTFLDFKQNDFKTREFLISILSEILINSKKLEFNDIADKYLKYIAETTGSKFYSLD